VDKLDLTKFDSILRQFAEELADLLSSLNPSNIEKHLALAKRVPTGFMEDEHFESPAVYSLLAYGQEGLQALYSLALQKSKASGSWDAAQALIAAACGDIYQAFARLYLSQTYLSDDNYQKLIDTVSINFSDKTFSYKAMQLSTRYIQTLVVTPEHRFELGLLFMTQFALGPKEDSEGRTFILEVIGKATLNISDEICESLRLIVDQDLNEQEYQQFFQRYPTLLDPMASSIIPLRNLGEIWKSDFVIKRLDDEYIFVEIEKPKDLLFTNYPHPSGALSHALGQVLNWFIWIEDNIAYAHSHGFPGIHSPRGLIVIGRTRDMNPSQLRMLKCLNDNLHPRIHIYSYDDVILNAQNIITNLTTKQ
jgi:hypothetical protein